MIAKVDRVSGRDHFDGIYRSELDREAEWLRQTAALKVHAVKTLLGRVAFSPRSLLELGCGTGAVIGECRRQALAGKYLAVDYSTAALDHLRQRDPAITAIQGDITAPDFQLDESVDTVICSHVVEHLENPGALLAALRDRIGFRYAILEVPLEALPGHRLKFRLLGRDQEANESGHVQFFTGRSFESLLRLHGFEILARRRYIPVLDREALRAQAQRLGKTSVWQLGKALTSNLLPRLIAPLWSRFYYAHLTVICQKAASR